MSTNKDGNGEKNVIGESTPIRIGLVIAFLAVFATSIWWASSISSKLDSVLAFQTTTQTTFSELKAKDISLDKDISDIKLKQAIMEVSLKAVEDAVNANSSHPTGK